MFNIFTINQLFTLESASYTVRLINNTQSNTEVLKLRKQMANYGSTGSDGGARDFEIQYGGNIYLRGRFRVSNTSHLYSVEHLYSVSGSGQTELGGQTEFWKLA